MSRHLEIAAAQMGCTNMGTSRDELVDRTLAPLAGVADLEAGR